MERYIRLDKEVILDWSEGFPVGNGRLGGMVSGFVPVEIMTLNHDALWYGPYRRRDREDAGKYLEKIRNLLKEGKVVEADKLCYMAMTSTPKYYGAYQPLGELNVHFNHSHIVTGYERCLDLGDARVTVEYDTDNMHIVREHFVSYPDQVMIMRITADKPEINIHFNMLRRPGDEGTIVLEDDILCMPGQCGADGVKFECMLGAQTDGELTRIGDFIGVGKASEVVIYISAESSFYTENIRKDCLATLRKAMEKGYSRILADHIADYHGLYDRARVDFKTDSSITLDKRLENVRNGKCDKGLFELMFNFGRYLMISSSRIGSQPSNLQGIWNKDYDPPWDCNYTININTEMNYWMAESSNLSECHFPLFELLERMVPNGERTARIVYNCDGFVAHHATDIHGDTAIEGISFPSSVWPMGGAWLALHMWNHYRYTLDTEFLKKKAFPVLLKSARFFREYMVNDEDGYYITGPSLSPENVYIMPDKSRGRECMGPEMDCQIVRALLGAVLNGYEILDIKDAEYEDLRDFATKIRPTRINHYGGIMEWDKDYEEAEPGHRHISHLFGVYPDCQINTVSTPELADACFKTLERRLGNLVKDTYMGLFGWSTAWMACCYARLGMGEKVLRCMEGFLQDSLSDSFLNNRPEFQVDGNFGMATAVVEMLLGSDDNGIHLLPALPAILSEGEFKGLRAKGAFTIDVQWKNGMAVNACVYSEKGGQCRLKAKGLRGAESEYSFDGEYMVLNTQPGKTYKLIF